MKPFYVYFNEKNFETPITRSYGNFTVDYAKDGRILGVEFLNWEKIVFANDGVEICNKLKNIIFKVTK